MRDPPERLDNEPELLLAARVTSVIAVYVLSAIGQKWLITAGLACSSYPFCLFVPFPHRRCLRHFLLRTIPLNSQPSSSHVSLYAGHATAKATVSFEIGWRRPYSTSLSLFTLPLLDESFSSRNG